MNFIFVFTREKKTKIKNKQLQREQPKGEACTIVNPLE